MNSNGSVTTPSRSGRRIAGREGEWVGLPARANERLVEIVKKVERGELPQDPRNITELRLN